ncbi:ABL046Cp [Eremothecium gossypii ATCC 10895]|uniref:ABL046Cp n=1 Tax=Eremothecium gossypii (strain ATCC 10895 / CBS 109.51 / FGSC 9923 / NRRL Y-1056) TaxID=284811 RepID=Q75DR3_EREGS|nr:ABL046Cp [Eremothecium gossypii ATCC 10895]AAS50725.1 ABL046Cp [Eremothecium gossypii ATCC 10895]AEY95014.1 FABL046Cp [Eremothecium gossypii FDAG1]
MAFDIQLFLGLPVDIRKAIYRRLDNRFTCLDPTDINGVNIQWGLNRSAQKRDWGLQEIPFRPYVDHYNYIPNFVLLWRQYMPWLRYDSVVLDYLRINQLYDGGLASLHWILIGPDPCIAIFDNDDDVLQVWFSLAEFRSWILGALQHPETAYCGEIDVVGNASRMYGALKIDTGVVLDIQQLFGRLNTTGHLDTVGEVVLTQEEFLSQGEIGKHINYSVSQLDSLRYLRTLKIRSDLLFHKFVNLRGARDNPGHTIGYNVRKRLRQLHLVGLRDEIAVCDLSKWDSCVAVKIENFSGSLDLDGVIMPRHLQRLILKNVRSVRWWRFREIHEITLDPNTFTKKQGFVGTIHGPDQDRVEVRQINRAVMSQDTYFHFDSLLRARFQNLNYISLHNVSEEITGIIVPHRLYCNGRISIAGCVVKGVVVI